MKLKGWIRLGIVLSGLWTCVVITAVGVQLHVATAHESGVLVDLVRGTVNDSPPFTIDGKPASDGSWVIAVVNYPVTLSLLFVPLTLLWLGIYLCKWVVDGFREEGESSASTKKYRQRHARGTEQGVSTRIASFFREQSRTAAGLLVFIGVIWLFGVASEESNSKDTVPSMAQQATSPSQAIAKPVLPLPTSGTIRRHTNSAGVAPLEIQTRPGTNFLVKLVNSDWKIAVLDVFVRGGDTVEVAVPLGNYSVKYASGSSWYGYENYFGPSTAYSKADSILHFTRDGNQYSGYTITLYSVVNGNLSTTQISASQF